MGGPAEQPAKPKRAFFRKWKWWQIGLVVVAAAGVAWLAYGYVSARAELSKLGTSKDGSEVKVLTGQIGKTIQLPDEDPTLATVNDVSKLKSQEFFRNAENGDKVLIFSNSGRALLYRPSTKKVIEYSKVDLNTGSK